MSSSDWEKVKQVFHGALEREESLRAAFLEDACGSDLFLRREVESLIASHRADPDFIERQALEVLAVDRPAVSDGPTGTRLGPYQLIKQVGKGGMGEVYLAVRDDDEYRKTVAVKLIRRDDHFDAYRREELLRRFRQERQTLANLDHPLIARLLDGGSTNDGLPYLVMEYVEGQPIDAYCHENRLDTRRVLELFCHVCSALQYAHQNLVVHRDLKPGNILVTRDGAPKLLDFGIAKLLDDGSLPAGETLTQTGLNPMTPAYASPEQIQGRPVTTASDVYSLGVILYELLTGVRPYRTEGTPYEIARAICEDEPLRPSTAVSRMERPASSAVGRLATRPAALPRTQDGGYADRLARRLAGDLDTIVLRALRKEPEHRYASVERFAEDIRRHLSGRPVLARKQTLRYTAGKFIRRNKVSVTVASLSVLTLIGLTFYSFEKADDAQREARAATQMFEFVVGLFEEADSLSTPGAKPDPRVSISAKDLVERGNEALSELHDQPLQQARLQTIMGRACLDRLGQPLDAQRLFEGSLAIRERILGPDHEDTLDARRDVGRALRDQEKWTEARDLLGDTLGRCRLKLGPRHSVTLETFRDYATVFRRSGEMEKAEPLYRQVFDECNQVYGESHVQTLHAANNLGLLLFERGKYDEAEPMLGRVIELRREQLGPSHPDTLTSMINLAELFRERGQYSEAKAQLRQVIDSRGDLPLIHPTSLAMKRNLANVLAWNGEFAEAEELARDVFDTERLTLGPGDSRTLVSQNNLALLLQKRAEAEKTGDYAAAEQLFRATLATRRRIQGDTHFATLISMNNLSNLLLAKGTYIESESKARGDGESLDYLEWLWTLGLPTDLFSDRLAAVGSFAEAEALAREAVQGSESAWPAGHLNRALFRRNWGEALAKLERFDEAETQLLAAYADLNKLFGDRHERTKTALNKLVDLYTAWDHPASRDQYAARLSDAVANAPEP